MATVAIERTEPGSAFQGAERQLACAVLERAVMDAQRRDKGVTMKREQELARKFLTAEGGPWAIKRKFWLDLAGIDSEAFDYGLKKRGLLGGAPTLATGSHGHRQEAWSEAHIL